MTVAVVILTLLILAVVTFVVSAPLRSAARGADRSARQRRAGASGGRVAAGPRHGGAGGAHVADTAEDLVSLALAREAKYREIRDAELDYRTGKLTRADYEAIDVDLRAEALAILDQLERARERGRPAPEGSAGP